jgi:predicted membrane chloride channel (bestrophin family)
MNQLGKIMTGPLSYENFLIIAPAPVPFAYSLLCCCKNTRFFAFASPIFLQSQLGNATLYRYAPAENTEGPFKPGLYV